MWNLLILAVMIWVWSSCPAAHVGIHDVAGFPAPEIAAPLIVVPHAAPADGDDGSEYELFDIKKLDDGGYWVCDLEVPVRGGPEDFYPVLYTLHHGDEVRIGERSHGTLGWAMIGRAEWVWEGSLCRR